MKRILSALFGLSIVLAAASVCGEDAPSFSRRAIVMTRALAYNSSLARNSGDSFVVGVLFKKGNPASERMSEDAAKAFKPLEAVKIVGLPFRAVLVPFAGAPALETIVDREGADALLICDGLSGDLPVIKQMTRRRKLLTLGVRMEQVQAGVSLAVVSEEGKLQVVVNLTQSREEGATFGSDLLRIARVVR